MVYVLYLNISFSVSFDYSIPTIMTQLKENETPNSNNQKKDLKKDID
ncbi:hypothetical protein M33023_06540 [Candidatus Phytoplasma asteris]|uniref:Uncharacterized protein n=1 Tax=Candidatus Phytoplasma asteris TaxID=85620 RepID=A0ABZ2YG80_9MOLU